MTGLTMRSARRDNRLIALALSLATGATASFAQTLGAQTPDTPVPPPAAPPNKAQPVPETPKLDRKAILAAKPVVTAIEIVDFGLYKDTITSTKKDDRSPYGTVSVADKEELIKQTDVICAEKGATFGIRFKIKGTPAGRGLYVDEALYFPAPGIEGPKGKVRVDRSVPGTLEIEGINYRAFEFIELSDMLPGTWRYSFAYKGKQLGGKSFTVKTDCKN